MLAVLQVDQIAWHKYDFFAIGLILLTAFACAVVYLIRAGLGLVTGWPLLIVACGTSYALTRYVASLSM